STSEGGGTSAFLTLTVSASGVAELPVFGTTTLWQAREDASIILAQPSAVCDADDALSATLSGIPAGWTVRDGTAALANGQGFAASDLVSRVVSAPDQRSEPTRRSSDLSTSEGGGTSAFLTLTVSASGVAELPVFGTTTLW